MSMFDFYVPNPAITCPKCKKAITDWQGKDGPCLLLVWEQSWAIPTGNTLQVESPEQLRLPDHFVISATCCGENFLAECECENGVWVKIAVKQSSALEILRGKYCSSHPPSLI